MVNYQNIYNLPAPIILLDVEYKVIFINNYTCNLLGYSPADLIGRNWLDLTMSSNCESDLNKLKSGVEVFSESSGLIRNSSGEDIIINWSITIDENSGSKHFVLIGRDDTQLIKTVESLKSSREMLKKAQEIGRIGHWLWTIQTNELEWSDEIYRIFALDKNSFDPTYPLFLEYVHPDDRDLVEQAVQYSLDTLQAYDIIHRIVRPNGQTLYVREQGAVQTDDYGNPIHMIGTVQDITDRKATEEQLRQSQKLEAIGRLSGGIAHDFNNLLGIIMGNLDLIRHSVMDDSTLLERVDSALDATELGGKLIHNLLSFSKQQDLTPESHNINKVLQNLIPIIDRTLKENINVISDLSPSIGNCRIDQIQLEAAILNLAINSRDAMPKGGEIKISTSSCTKIHDLHKDEGEGEYICLSIEDTGEGIDSSILERVVEPFFTTKDVGKGYGLGLSMVHGFVQQSGGHIKISSKDLKGTKVDLYFPSISEGTNNSTNCTDIKKLIVIEDNASMLALICDALTRSNVKPLPTASGDEAIDILKENMDVDIIISDVVLPGQINGFTLAQKLRDLKDDLRFIFISGFTNKSECDQILKSLDAVLIKKPFRINDLIAAIEKS